MKYVILVAAIAIQTVVWGCGGGNGEEGDVTEEGDVVEEGDVTQEDVPVEGDVADIPVDDVQGEEGEVEYPGPAYPRLAMWWPSSWEQDVSDLARYDYIGWGNWENDEVLLQIKERNPQQLHFTAITVTETGWGDWSDESELMNRIPDVWFLMQVGSTLREDIDAGRTTIEVNETLDWEGNPLFEVGDTLACGFESMELVDVDYGTYTLTVERGFARPAESHSAGDRIAAHITFWPGTWVMNLSMLCPEFDAGEGPQRWAQWAVGNIVPAYWHNQRDGYIIDRIEDSQSWLVYGGSHGRNIDPDCSNTLVDDYYEGFDAAWQEGIREFLPQIREMLDGKSLFGNTFGAYCDLLNGSIYESCPGNWSDTVPETFEDWAERVLGDEGYIEVSGKGFFPNFSFVETYELEEYLPDPEINNPLLDPEFVPNYKRMRFGLTTALLGDGYFSYEVNTNGHGTLGLMWFDEYDNAGDGRGYMGYPVADAAVLEDFEEEGQVFRRDYEHGIVLCNPSDRGVSVYLGGEYQLITGTQDPEANSGEVVSSISLDSQDGRILLTVD